jgi:hypothetical protein
MKKPKKQLTEAETVKLDQEIQQGWNTLDKAVDLMLKKNIIKTPPKWYKSHKHD